MSNADKIPVMEIFGPTIQGEGMVIGRKTMFVRTAGCDYQCVWCDSAFTWNGSEKERTRFMTPQEVVEELVRLGDRRFNHVTISGGNPALIDHPMQELIRLCHESGWKVGLETQGSRSQPWFHEIDDLTVSPKPPSSKMTTNFEVLDSLVDNLKQHQVHFSLKIVIFDDADLEYARQVFARYPDVPQFLQVGNDRANDEGGIANHLLTRMNWLFEKVVGDPKLNHARVLPQLHALVWGNERER